MPLAFLWDLGLIFGDPSSIGANMRKRNMYIGSTSANRVDLGKKIAERYPPFDP